MDMNFAQEGEVGVQVSPPTWLILDSGIGGFSYLQALLQLIEKQDGVSVAPRIIYVADTLYFPYSGRSAAEIQERLAALMRWLIPRYQPQLVITACNTMTTQMQWDEIPGSEKMMWWGVSPALQQAQEVAQGGGVLILATHLTARSAFLDRSLAALPCDQMSGAWIRMGSSDLVRLAEASFFQKNSMAGSSHMQDHLLSGDLRDERDRFRSAMHRVFSSTEVSVILLSCTHFIFALEEIQEALGACQMASSPRILCSSELKAHEHIQSLKLSDGAFAFHQSTTCEVMVCSGYGGAQRSAIRHFLQALGCRSFFAELPEV